MDDTRACPPLPQKIWDHIFSYMHLHWSIDRASLRAVCHPWKDALDTKYPLRVFVNNESYIWTLNATHVYFAAVKNLTKEIRIPIKFVETIRQMEFRNIVVSYNLISVLGQCHPLERLILSNITLDLQNKIDGPNGMSLPNLNLLSIKMNGYVHFNLDELILITFLKDFDFGLLKYLDIQGGEGRVHVDNEYTLRAVKNEIQQNRNQDNLPPGIRRTALLELMIKNGQSLKNVFIYSRHCQPFGYPIEDFREELGKIQLELMCGWYFFREPSPINGNSILLFEAQKNLKCIHVIETDAFAWPSLISTFQRNKSTLTTIFIVFSNDYPEVNVTPVANVDLSVFQTCSNLESLTFLTRNIPKTNINCLPDSILELSTDVNLTEDEVLMIVSRLTKLKHFIWYLYKDYPDSAFFTLLFFQTFARMNNTLETICLPLCNMDFENISNHYKETDGIRINRTYLHGEDIEIHNFVNCELEKNFDRSLL